MISDGEPNGQWKNVGYLTDNTLCAKMVEYYLKNKDNIK